MSSHSLYRERLRRDLAANSNSAKGRLIMRLFRFGQRLPKGLARSIYQPFYYFFVDVTMGVSLPLLAQIEGGLTLRHGQGVVVSWKSSIGANCELHQNVTLGERNSAAPQLGANVIVGANAVLIGGITIGDGARIGAGAVVVTDVPAGATAIGPKASIILKAPRGEASA